jgi:hypothetical protein
MLLPWGVDNRVGHVILRFKQSVLPARLALGTHEKQDKPNLAK